jgi:hypothetical protein
LCDDSATSADEVLADVGSGDSCADAVIVGVGAPVGPAGLTPLSPEPQAAVTATSASPAMNRAGARGVRPVERKVRSGLIHAGSGGAQSAQFLSPLQWLQAADR